MSSVRDGGAAGGPVPVAGRNGGHIEVITGGMFSGKSEELVRRLRRAVIARQQVQVFKPAADLRSAPERLVTRDKRELDALAVASSRELRASLEAGVEVIGIDEAQFFDDALVHLLQELADRGLRVIVAGLDLDYRRRPFGPMPELLAVAEYVDKMHAVCVRCGSPAQYSQRIAGPEDQRHLGDTESYEARCRACYQPFRSHGDEEPPATGLVAEAAARRGPE
ncbi:MAG TPA: thymidine kinase [Thermoanaerobaculia bacterium]|nr:thymidine kinase [Thermoanaerobaculia bacterium]